MCFAVLTALQGSGARLEDSTATSSVTKAIPFPPAFSAIEILVPYTTLAGAFFV
jgi:hypothetical protein